MKGSTRGYGEGTEYFFEYGPTSSYGSVATGEEIEGNGESLEVEEVAVNLAPESTYHYRLVTEGPTGTAYGSDQTFTTGKRTRTIKEEEERAFEESPLEGGEPRSLVTPQATPAPPNFFGMMWDGNIKQMVEAGDFTAIKDSGAGLFRFVVAEFNESEQELAFAESKRLGLTALPYLGAGPFPKAGEPRANFYKFAKEMIKKYGPEGTSYKAKTWELWNEPNMPHPVNQGESPPIYENTTHQGNVKPYEFADFYQGLVTEIRKVAPEITILAPGLFGYKSNTKKHETPRRFLREFDAELQKEPALQNPYQGISLHPYVFKTRNAKKKHEKRHVPRNEFDAKQVRTEIKGMIEGVQYQVNHDLKTTKPIWVTELGFPVKSEEPKSIPEVSSHMQEVLIHATFPWFPHSPPSLKIEHAIYYNIQDLPGANWEHNAGLLEESVLDKETKKLLPGSPRPAWEAFRNAAGGKACTVAPC